MMKFCEVCDEYTVHRAQYDKKDGTLTGNVVCSRCGCVKPAAQRKEKKKKKKIKDKELEAAVSWQPF
jgi:hypothetical protein